MNSAINIASPSPQKSSDIGASSAAKSDSNAMNSGEAGELEASARSFHDSIQKAYDDSQNNAESENAEADDNEENGKNLPEEGDFPELAADDDRLILPGGLYLSGESPQAKAQSTKNPAIDADTENTIESDVEAELKLAATMPTADKATDTTGKTGETASQLRQPLSSETGADTKKAQIARSRLANTGNDGSTEKTLELKMDMTPVKIEPTLTADKFQALLNTGSQQQPLQNIQTSLLLQTASAQADAGDDALALVTNTATGSLSGTNLQATLPQTGIAEAFGRPGWSQAMGKQILMMVNQNISTAEIRLNPAHLGPIEVLIDMSEERVNVSMSSRHAMVREAMEQALPRLREMLEQNGFTLADADISKHSFAEQREQNPRGEGRGIAASNIDQSLMSDTSQQSMTPAALSNSMVDYYI